MRDKSGFGQRINAWLDEAPGETFREGKWRFWFVALIAFSILNAILTALVFDAGGVLQTHMGSVLVGVGALLAWIGVGSLHYSDSIDPKLARGVSALDSITLLFVVAHFCFLMWCYGHTSTLKSAEAEYKAEAEKFNDKARQVQADNAKIADALRQVAESETKRARIENDSIYQARKAAQAGARIQTGRSQSAVSGISISPVELAKPPAPPKQSSADYLTEWDAWIRLANFGELALAILTLIFIRNRTAATNARSSPVYREDNFPDEIDTESRSPARRERLETTPAKFAKKKETAKKHGSFDFAKYAAGAKALRDVLKDISFRLHGRSFKVGVKPDCVWILMMRANQGTQETVSSMCAKLTILSDVVTMDRNAFRARLERMLRQNGFEI